MADASVLTDEEVLAFRDYLDNTADPIRARMEWMVNVGLLEVHPDDADKPWEARRLKRTAKGDAFFAEMEVNGGD